MHAEYDRRLQDLKQAVFSLRPRQGRGPVDPPRRLPEKRQTSSTTVLSEFAAWLLERGQLQAPQPRGDRAGPLHAPATGASTWTWTSAPSSTSPSSPAATPAEAHAPPAEVSTAWKRPRCRSTPAGADPEAAPAPAAGRPIDTENVYPEDIQGHPQAGRDTCCCPGRTCG